MSRSQAETAVAGYIDGFYNPVRRHADAGLHKPRQELRGITKPLQTVSGRLHFVLTWVHVGLAIGRVHHVSIVPGSRPPEANGIS